MQVGALIAAAGKTSRMEAFRPMLKLNGTTLIQKEIDTLRRAGASPIVVITGYAAEELERHLAHRGVVCIRNSEYENTQMLESVKLGLAWLQGRCDRVVFLPADAPLFSLDSLEAVMSSDGEIVIPYHGTKSGHPILISAGQIPGVLTYEGEGGLKGAMEASGAEICRVEVKDPGILMEVHDEDAYREVLEYEKKSIEDSRLDWEVKLELGKSTAFFDESTAAFLELIDEKGSMLAACKALSMSYSRGWKMIKEAEDSMGFPFLEKKAGGSTGGNSRLTEDGRDFLERYRRMQQDVEKAAEHFFHLYFG